jgi:hypothetical protein
MPKRAHQAEAACAESSSSPQKITKYFGPKSAAPPTPLPVAVDLVTDPLGDAGHDARPVLKGDGGLRQQEMLPNPRRAAGNPVAKSLAVAKSRYQSRPVGKGDKEALFESSQSLKDAEFAAKLGTATNSVVFRSRFQLTE